MFYLVYGEIYKITNKFDQKVYIGQTTMTIEQRIMLHLSDSQKFYSFFYNEFYAYGIKDMRSFLNVFEYESICKAYDKEDLNNKENYFIKQYDSDNPEYGYNTSKRVYCLDSNGNILKEYDSIKQAADATGIKYMNIIMALKKDSYTGGYKWKYVYRNTFENDLLTVIRKHNIAIPSKFYINGFKIDFCYNGVS